jgi:hypothetical protein
MKASLTSTGKLSLQGDVVMRGVTGGVHRGIHLMESESKFKEEETTWLNFQPHLGTVVDSITQVKGLELDDEFTYHFGAHARALMLDVDGVWVMQLPLPQIQTIVPEFEDGTIKYGVDLRSFFPVSPQHSTVDLVLPADLQVHSLPAPVQVSSPFGEYELKMTSTPEGVRIERRIHFTRFIIEQRDMAAFLEFHNKVITADQTILKLRKKK